MLKSFFAPSTAKLGHGQEIKRKPVNWGNPSPDLPSSFDESESAERDMEKIPMTASAAPMGQIERYSMVARSKTRDAPRSPVGTIMELPADTNPASVRQPSRRVPGVKELDSTAAPGPISPISLRAKPSLSSMPPVSPMSMHVRGLSTTAGAERELPALPPVPSLPPLIHAKRGSDGVFRLK